MTIKTLLLPNEKAEFVQSHASEYGCKFVEKAVVGNHSAKVTVSGEDANVKKLFNQIGE